MTDLLTSLDVDEYLALTTQSSTSGIFADALGSPVALSDPAGSVDTEYAYQPFGAVTVSGILSQSPIAFTGRENDQTGLYNYRARYYHPGLHRFISEDPMGLAGGDSNLYAYVRANPVNFVDPLGFDLIVRYYCCNAGNGFGHIGIGVNDGPSLGFYAKYVDPMLFLDSPVPGHIVPDAEHFRSDQVLSTIRIPTTIEQDRAVQSFLDRIQKEPGEYRLYGRNCGTIVQALRVGGIDLGHPTQRISEVVLSSDLGRHRHTRLWFGSANILKRRLHIRTSLD